MSRSVYAAKKQRLVQQLRDRPGGSIRLGKTTSNLFRDRKLPPKHALDVRDFDQVLHVDAAAGFVEVEGMTPYARLVDACLAQGVMPAVVPQLKSITIGGAIAGVGIESSSFRYGLVHETVQEVEVLLADGRVVTCTPDNEHSDLFFGFPNSYGTLGYALRVRAGVVPVRPFVRLTHRHHTAPEPFLAELASSCERTDIDFVDGVVFGRDDLVITLGQFTDSAPWTSDYTYEHIYYRSLRERDEDYLTTADYLWRWDTDWFWCSANLLAQHPVIRRLYGRRHLNSMTYTKLMRLNSRWQITRRLERLRGLYSESVIQDVEIPLARAAEFLDFYHAVIRFLPVWVCPVRAWRRDAHFDLYALDTDTLYLNFGFWDVIRSREKRPPGYYNRQVEQKVIELGGRKSLYSDSFFTPEEFWQLYNKPAYDRLREKYDPQGRLRDLYRKCVLRE